jgi:hypothetical protein
MLTQNINDRYHVLFKTDVGYIKVVAGTRWLLQLATENILSTGRRHISCDMDIT